jgi:KipI family sensor histidine kinase inhibitor
MTFNPTIVPLGDAAVLIQAGGEIDLVTNRLIHALGNLIDQHPHKGILETVPAYTTLLVHYDPFILSFEEIQAYLHKRLDQLQGNEVRRRKQIEVPTHYGGEYGIDLEFVARHCQLSVEEVIRIHSETIYTVYMMGFTPGYPYMGKLDDRIITPRLKAPRTRVPAGTVAIAGSQTGIYSIDSPGGWQLIGWTPLHLFDPDSESPFLFSPGDEVRFVPA